MSRRIAGTATLLLLWSAACPARAQSVRFEPAEAPVFQVSLATGLDDAVVPLQLSGAVALEVGERPLTIGASLFMPMLDPGFDDFAAEVFADFELNDEFGWMVRPRLSLSLQTTSNEVFDATGLEVGVGVFGGWSDPVWALGAEVVGRLNVVSHLRASQWSLDYASLAPDAALWGQGYVVEVGARGGVLLGPVELSLRVGWQRRGDYSQAPPVYATLGLGVRWR